MKSWHVRSPLYLKAVRWRILHQKSSHTTIAVSALVAVMACQKAPTDVREWSPKDHTNTGAGATGGQLPQRQPSAPSSGAQPPPGLDSVTLAAWSTNCSSCHGKIGQGDGPQGPMLKATDLSNPEWQQKATDEQIRSSITSGKNQMPAFTNLAQPTVDNLVLLVRWFNSDQEALKQRLAVLRGAQQGDRPTPGSSVAPSVSARPTPSPSSGRPPSAGSAAPNTPTPVQ